MTANATLCGKFVRQQQAQGVSLPVTEQYIKEFGNLALAGIGGAVAGLTQILKQAK